MIFLELHPVQLEIERGAVKWHVNIYCLFSNQVKLTSDSTKYSISFEVVLELTSMLTIETRTTVLEFLPDVAEGIEMMKLIKHTLKTYTMRLSVLY